jgi:hypothetical protein
VQAIPALVCSLYAVPTTFAAFLAALEVTAASRKKKEKNESVNRGELKCAAILL